MSRYASIRDPRAPWRNAGGVLFILAFGWTSVATPQVKRFALLHPDAVGAETYTRVAAVRHLLDGRLLVLDANEQKVSIVNFQTASAQQLGRLGSGPKEYRYPSRLLDLQGDSLGIVDPGNARILVVDGMGRLAGVLDLWGRPISGTIKVPGTAPERSDRHGRLYALGLNSFAPMGSQLADSAPLERWLLGSSTRDTVAYVPLAPLSERVIQPGSPIHAYATEPQWRVDPDGNVAVLHIAPYHIEVIAASRHRTVGPVLPYTPVPLTEAHKRLWDEDQARPRPVMILRPGANALPVAGLRAMPKFPDVAWPRLLPPFLDDAGDFSPDGLLWVQRTTPVGAEASFDLVGPDGALVGTVHAPPGTRLVGFGGPYVYLARVDTDGQETLERYRRPAR